MFEKLRELCIANGIAVTDLCKQITGSSGNLPTWKKGNIKADTLVKIADYFNISVDYLLGRTDEPSASIKTGDILKGDNSHFSENTVSIGNKENDVMKSDFIKIFDSLSTEDKIKVMYSAVELKNKEE